MKRILQSLLLVTIVLAAFGTRGYADGKIIFYDTGEEIYEWRSKYKQLVNLRTTQIALSPGGREAVYMSLAITSDEFRVAYNKQELIINDDEIIEAVTNKKLYKLHSSILAPDKNLVKYGREYKLTGNQVHDVEAGFQLLEIQGEIPRRFILAALLFDGYLNILPPEQSKPKTKEEVIAFQKKMLMTNGGSTGPLSKARQFWNLVIAKDAKKLRGYLHPDLDLLPRLRSKVFYKEFSTLLKIKSTDPDYELMLENYKEDILGEWNMITIQGEKKGIYFTHDEECFIKGIPQVLDQKRSSIDNRIYRDMITIMRKHEGKWYFLTVIPDDGTFSKLLWQ